jgi:hypothetical protein
MSLLVKKIGLFSIFTLFTLQETSFFENILFFPWILFFKLKARIIIFKEFGFKIGFLE